MRKNTFFLGLLLSITAQVCLHPLLFSEGRAKTASQELWFNRAWAEKAFAGVQTKMAPNNRLVLVHEDTPSGTKKNLSSAGGKIRLGEKTYAHGIGVTSRSVLQVKLTKPAVRFRADIGLDRIVDHTNTSVRFGVNVGGKHVFLSEFMKPSGAVRSIDVPLDGALAFDLIVEAGPDSQDSGQADWADASVLLQDGSQLRLDELADQWELGADLPFSFLLDGHPSSEFLSEWKRDVQLEQLDQTRLRRTVTLQDPKTGIELRAVATIYTDTPGVDWTLYFSNHGSQDTPIIEKLNALDVTLNPGVGTTPRFYRLRGSNAAVDDWQPFEDSVEPGQRIEFAPTNGRSSETACPFFNLQYGGGGVITAIGWSGQWSASAERNKDGKIRIQAGMQNLHLRLHPGESIRSPRILQLYWFGDDSFRALNLFRSTMLSHIGYSDEGGQ